MRYICSLMLLFLLLADAAHAQSVRSGVGLSLFPHLSHRRLVAVELGSPIRTDSLDAAERSLPTYALGVAFSHRGEKVGVQAAVHYSRMGYRGSRAAIPLSNPLAARFSEQEYRFVTQQIEVPFGLVFYQALSDKDEFFFLLGSGISYNMVNNDTYVRYEGDISETETTRTPGDFRRLNYCFQTGMGWEHRLDEKWSLSIAPVFRLWMAGLYREAELNRNLYQMGIHFVLRKG